MSRKQSLVICTYRLTSAQYLFHDTNSSFFSRFFLNEKAIKNNLYITLGGEIKNYFGMMTVCYLYAERF